MAVSYPYKYGDTEPRKFPVAADTQIDSGDLVHYNSTTDTIEPASTLVQAGGQAALHDGFVGIAIASSQNIANSHDGLGETHEIAVATRGTFLLPLTAALGGDVEAGAFVGANDAGANLDNKSVETVGAGLAGLAVGVVAGNAANGDTDILVEIVSTKVHGGVQVPSTVVV